MPSPRDPARDPSSVGTRAPTSSRASPTSDPILFSPFPPRRSQDVLGDGSIVKSRVNPGADPSARRRPSVGDQVDFTVRRATAQGAPSSGVVRQDDAFERYTVGDGACCRGVELALETMREGETAFFHVRVRHLTPTTAYPEEVRITLRRVHPDVVPARGVEGECDASSVASVVKTRERWGAAKTEGSTAYLAAVAAKTLRRDARDIGRVVARRGWRARLAVEPGKRGRRRKESRRAAHESVSAAVVDVVVGAGRAAEALELAVALSSPGERFRVTFATHAYGRADADADAESDADAEAADAAAATAKSTTATTAKSTTTTTITAEVLSLDPPEGDDDVEGMSLEARMRRAEAEKERGVALYRAGRFRAAVRAYDACVDALVAPFAPRAFVPDVVDEGDETAEGAAAVASSPFGAAAVASSPFASSLPTPSSPGPSARARRRRPRRRRASPVVVRTRGGARRTTARC